MSKEENIAGKQGERKNTQKKETVLKNIRTNYIQLEKSIVEQLYMVQDLHGTTIGTMREEIWKNVFEMIIPKKFVIEHSVFIIDSKDGVSHEVDLAIIDEIYTPYILRYGKIKFIPIEAVTAVVECKSKQVKLEQIMEWCDSIEKLQTCSQSICRTIGGICFTSPKTQKATRPIRILCRLEDDINTYEKKDSGKYSKMREKFDFMMIAYNRTQKKQEKKGQIEPHIEIVENKSFKNLQDWYETLNFYNCNGTEYEAAKELDTVKELSSIRLEDYQVYEIDEQTQKKKNISLLSFNFQFNQLLMLINNPMPFPHQAYAERLNEVNQ